MHTVVELLVVDEDANAAWAWDERGKNDVLVVEMDEEVKTDDLADEMDKDVTTDDLVDETSEGVKTDDLVDDETDVRRGACIEAWEYELVLMMIEDGAEDAVKIWLVVIGDSVSDRAKFTPGSDAHLVSWLGSCDGLLLKEKM